MTQYERPQPVDLTPHGGTITSGGTAQPLAAANPKRSYLYVQNLDAAHDLWLAFGVDAVASQPSMKLAPGVAHEWNGPRVPRQAVSGIGGTTGQAWVVMES